MPRKISSSILVVFALPILFAWSPWLTRAYAETRAVEAFDKAWEFVVDGCGTNCKGCGTVSSQRVPFGVLVTIEYACGLIPADTPEYHQRATAFVSSLGTVHRIPEP
jgi:hypothetical protein